jgi:hypothetical protein
MEQISSFATLLPGLYVTSEPSLITLAVFRKAQCTPLKPMLLNRVTFKQPLISK